GAADGSLDAGRMREVYAHLAACAECAADLQRLRMVMARTREAPVAIDAQEDLWPSIRARIDRSKVVPLGATRDPGARTGARRPWLAIASTVIAAALLIVAFAEMQHWRPGVAAAPAAGADVAFASAADSSRMYENESRRLLNELEMQRAMMPPSARASLDSDLAVIDRSIAELKDAVVHDPRNVSLQRLLAASYRQKVELLERANNAG
ncbi:MAG TPA: zf-HC2 domain-containing protein, partial [Gemmatimonadaceae bacterium]|nr:zf-HC2 domain-containing protein [Gemmatimonadaceae bacterium]